MSDESLSNLTKQLGLFDFAYGEFGPRRSIGPVRWPRFDLFWVHEGEVLLRLMERHEERLPAGRGVLIYSHTHFVGRSISKRSRASVHHFTLDAKPDAQNLPLALRRLLGCERGYRRYEPRDAGAIAAALDQSIRWAAWRQTAAMREVRAAHWAMTMGLLEADAKPFGATDAQPAEFERVVEWLQRRLDQPVSLREMAAQAGLSPSHFRARFRELYGASPGGYHLQMRMFEAARQLCETTLPIKTIAQRAGYTALPNFHRAFKGKVGFSPADYRRRHAPRG